MESTMQGAPKKRVATRARKTAKVETRTLKHDEIAQRARALYEQSGFAVGRDEEFWLEAERQLRDEISA